MTLTVTAVTPLVTTFAELDAAIQAADKVAAGTGALEIDISGTIAEGGDLAAIDLATGNTLTINGVNGATLDGGGLHRGLFVYSGAVDISDLTIQYAEAAGGAGGGGAGGGAGLRWSWETPTPPARARSSSATAMSTRRWFSPTRRARSRPIRSRISAPKTSS